jgi:hypothetical protein
VVGYHIVNRVPGNHIELLHHIGLKECEQVFSGEEENVGGGDNLCLGILFANHRDDLPNQIYIVQGQDALELLADCLVLQIV